MDNKIKVVEMKADEEVEIYRKKLLEKTKNEVEEFRKNYDIIQLNEIHQKEMELEKKLKETIIIKKQELIHQEDKAFTIRKQEIENAFNKIIKSKQHELEEKYQKRIMNIKLITNNTPQINSIETSKAVIKIINDLKDEINSLNKNLSLEKQINENNSKKIKALEQNRKNEIQKLLKNHFIKIDNNTIFNNKTLSLFDKNYLEKLYKDITNKSLKDIYNNENENIKEKNNNSMDENCLMENRLNKIYAAFQIYTWKLHESINEYENEIKNINWKKKLGEPSDQVTNDEIIKLENKYKMLLKEKETEYLRILTELELDNYIKETKLIEESLLNNSNFNNLHYEERLKALEAQYQSCMKVIDNEKKSTSALTNENKKLRQIVEKNRRTIEYDNKLLKKYRKQVDFLEKSLNMETQSQNKVLQGYIQKIHQEKGKRGRTKTAEFVNIDGVINTCKRGDDDSKPEDDPRQKDAHSELTTGDFITSLNTDRYNTRENDNHNHSKSDSENTENVDKETDTIDLDSYDTARTTEMSTEFNSEEIKKEDDDDNNGEEDDDDGDDDNSDYNSDNSNQSDNNHKRKEDSSDSDEEDDKNNDETDESLFMNKKKSRKGKMKYFKKNKNRNNVHKKLKTKKNLEKYKTSKKDKKENGLNNKEDILQMNDENKYDLNDNNNLDSSSEEEEVSDSIKEEIKNLLEDIPELKNKYYILNKTGEGTFSSVYKALRIDEEKKRKERIRKKKENIFYTKKIKDKKYYALKRIYATSSPQRIENEISILHDL
eukprot:jgi/Orpsp1_1/1190577/evm.model.d7180000079869.1